MDDGAKSTEVRNESGISRLRQAIGWVGILALLIWFYAAVAGFLFGGVLSAFLGFLAGAMAWQPAIDQRRAQGLKTISDGGRIGAGLMFLMGSIALFPASSKAPVTTATDAPVAQGRSCTAADRATNVDMGVQEDGSQLRITPDTNSKYLMWKVGDEEVPHGIDGSTVIREECRSGSWSRVRIVAPNQFRNVAGWVPSAELVRLKTTPDGRRIYKVADFDWNPGSTANHAAVVTALNTVLRQNPSCEAYDTAALLVSDTSRNPNVDAVCVGPKGDQHLVFTPDEVRKGKIVKAVMQEEPSTEVTTTLTQQEASRQCDEATLDRLQHPSTADFSILDTTFSQTGNETRYSVALTAKNSFGLELRLITYCVFDGGNLTSADVVERR